MSPGHFLPKSNVADVKELEEFGGTQGLDSRGGILEAKLHVVCGYLELQDRLVSHRIGLRRIYESLNEEVGTTHKGRHMRACPSWFWRLLGEDRERNAAAPMVAR